MAHTTTSSKTILEKKLPNQLPEEKNKIKKMP